MFPGSRVEGLHAVRRRGVVPHEYHIPGLSPRILHPTALRLQVHHQSAAASPGPARDVALTMIKLCIPCRHSDRVGRPRLAASQPQLSYPQQPAIILRSNAD
ncbi:unnamed protein product [Arctogadus glacialis]